VIIFISDVSNFFITFDFTDQQLNVNIVDFGHLAWKNQTCAESIYNNVLLNWICVRGAVAATLSTADTERSGAARHVHCTI
jgi:hypothetical protein